MLWKAMVGVAAVLAVAAAPAVADQTRDQRRQVAPLIRSLTDCVARKALEDDAGAAAYRANTFGPFAIRMISRCQDDVNLLIETYDHVSGEGAGIAFLNGPYSADLPRAVLKRIQLQLQAQLDAQDKAQAEEAAREAHAEAAAAIQQQQEDAERQARLAEAEQKAAQAKAAAAQAQAEASTAASKAEAARQLQIADSKKAEGLLVDKAADCARHQLAQLVRSGESAEVLATAVMTICGSDVNAMLDGGIQEYKLENNLADSTVGEGIYREKLRANARDQITALAVQAKAGVGAFAPASSN